MCMVGLLTCMNLTTLRNRGSLVLGELSELIDQSMLKIWHS